MKQKPRNRVIISASEYKRFLVMPNIAMMPGEAEQFFHVTTTILSNKKVHSPKE